MKLDIMIRLVLGAACCAFFAARLPAAEPGEPEKAVFWSSSLVDGYRRAFADRKPLFIVVGAKWCAPCRKMARELEEALAQEELARWTAVCLDRDLHADDAEQLGVVTTPALRIHSPTGQEVAEHNGYLAPDEMVAWLKKHYRTATAAADDVLLGAGKPSFTAVIKLVKQFEQRNPALREAAVRRLIPYRDEAITAVLKAFCERGLSARLVAMEVLEQWRAPLDGFDPWRPETFTPDRIAKLEQWKEQDFKAEDAQPKQLTPEQLASARKQIERMLRGNEMESSAIRHRLARLGMALMPEVYARLKEATVDRDRRRLLTLRYRLVADDVLVLSWPGGIERLADRDPRRRRKAAEELAERATATDQPLLLELFADPDALVREISLRGLQHIGGKQANAVLVRLLDDPDLNVRAAVLKQLEAEPSPAMTSAIVKYLQKEKDPDLIGHGIRVLQAGKGTEVVKCLISLLKHESWQVRAEAVTALGKVEQPSNSSPFSLRKPDEKTQLAVDVYVALLDLLDDPEPFVVAKAVEGLSGADLAVAVEPMAKAAVKYPDLAPTILKMLASGSTMRVNALPHLREFTKHEEPRIRAAAITALCYISFNDTEEKLLEALGDEDSLVRMAAASAALDAFDKLRRKARKKRSEAVRRASRAVYRQSSPTIDVNLFSLAAKLLSGAIKPAAPPATKPTPKEAKPADDAERPDEKDDNKNKKNPFDEKPQPEVNWWDQWLREFYAGGNRPKWTDRMVPLLEKMLAAESPKERIMAAVLLIPLGKSNKALPVLQQSVREKPELMDPAVNVLIWLVWEERLKAFRDLHALVSDEAAFLHLINALETVSDLRAADLYWQLLADPKITLHKAQAILMGLIKAYSGSDYFSSDIGAAARRKMIEAAKPYALTGSDWQRRGALIVLSSANKDEAATVAKTLAGDTKLSDAVRNTAFRVQLATQSTSQAQAAAVAELGNTNLPRKKIALTYLAHGAGALRAMPDSLYLFSITTYSSYSSNRPIVPKLPRGLKTDDVRGLLNDADPETAAFAGYLAVLLGDHDGIEPLLKYWREKQRDSDQWTKSVYRAIAVIDDPKYIPVLREIYAKLDEYDMKEFYWTIRIMSGAEILEFRKRVRDAMKKADTF